MFSIVDLRSLYYRYRYDIDHVHIQKMMQYTIYGLYVVLCYHTWKAGGAKIMAEFMTPAFGHDEARGVEKRLSNAD